MSKYAESLKNGEAKLEEALIPHKVVQAQKQCELKVAEMDENVAQLTINLERAKGKHPLDLTAVINAANALAIATKNIETAKTVIKELFA